MSKIPYTRHGKNFIIYENIQGDKFSATDNDCTFQNRTMFIDF